MSKDDKRRVNKVELEKLIESHLALMANDPNELRNVITNTINLAIDKKFEQFSRDTFEDFEKLKNGNNTIRKAVCEQQKFLENLHRERVRNHVFMTGIPNELEILGEIKKDSKTIIHNIFQIVNENVSQDDYEVVKSSKSKPFSTKHSAKIVFKTVYEGL